MYNKFLRVLTVLVLASLSCLVVLVGNGTIPSEWYYSISEMDFSFMVYTFGFEFIGFDFILIHIAIALVIYLAASVIINWITAPTTTLMSWFYDSYGCKRLLINKITEHDGEEVYRLTTVNGEHIQDFTWFNQAQTFAYSYMVANYDIF